MNVTLFNFGAMPVRVITDDSGELWFVGSDVATILEYSATSAMNRRLDEDDKGVRELHTPGGAQQMTVISEPGFYTAIIGSQSAKAAPVKRWLTHEVLPSIRRTGGYGVQQAQAPSASDATVFIESAARALNLSPSATLQMYQKYGAKIGQADLLPVYAIDAPDGDTSSHTTAALATLIKKNGLPATARKAYLCMQSAGLVERKERPSKTRGTKEFWALTDAGLKYGKNVTNPKNQLEVQVHIFESKFDDLCELLDTHDLR